MKTLELLETVGWAEDLFGSLVTTRSCARRDVMREVKNGLTESIGPVALCDDDGGILDPERYREGFRLTKKGREFLEANQSP